MRKSRYTLCLTVECGDLMSIRQSLQLTSPFLTRLGLFFGVFENCPRPFARRDDVLLKSAILPEGDVALAELLDIAGFTVG
jgi:hypothetical protein